MPARTALAVAALLTFPAGAGAAVTASEDANVITITGTADIDVTELTDNGTDVQITNATAGAGCVQNGTNVLCPRGSRTITANLGAGNDNLRTTSAATATLNGQDGSDTLVGGPAADTLRGGIGVDKLEARAGDDVVVGGPEADFLDGEVGTDTVSFAEDSAAITVNLASGIGSDPEVRNFENVVGSPFNDTIAGTDSANNLDGAAGTDTLTYAGRTTAVSVNLAAGTAAEDTVANFENATGGTGADSLTGTTGPNILNGGDGNDGLKGDLGADVLIGGNGTDQVRFDYLPTGVGAGITHTIAGLAANNTEGDSSLEIEDLLGSRRDDVLTGTTGNNLLSGLDGADRLVPLAGNDSVRGGAGSDTLDYTTSPVAIHANLNAVGGLEVREFASTQTTDTPADEIENISGSAFADVLRGTNTHANAIVGNGGNDVIDGGNGDDTLRGDLGSDRFGKVASSVLETATAAQVVVGNSSGDGADTVLGGSGNDDVNVRDSFLDTRVDCGTGTDIARQDLVDDDQNLDVDNCETLETTAIDQLMTAVKKVRRNGRRLVLRLACPKRAGVPACAGSAGLARRAGATARRSKRYRIRKGRAATVRLRGRGRFLVLTEQDTQKRVRRTVRRL